MFGKMSRSAGPSIGVVYLARFADGPVAFARFADSYRKHAAGSDHDLIVLFKGFPDPSQTRVARDVFRGIPHISVELDDTGFDIGSYLAVSKCVTHRYLLFFNTYTELLADGWLTHYRSHALREGVGIIGAMGSYESLYSSFGLIQSIIWMCNHLGVAYDEALYRYFGFIIDLYCKNWIGGAPKTNSSVLQRVRAELKAREILLKCYCYWWYLTLPGNVFSDYGRFSTFPNPHIRSNGFMIRRDMLSSWDVSDIQSKLDACAFESGADSLTNKVRKAGYAAITVDRFGQGYDVNEWPRARLFRLADQGGLLISDNQTKQYAEMSEGARAAHRRMTWGDFLDPMPADFPLLPFAFGNGSLGANLRRGPAIGRGVVGWGTGRTLKVMIKALSVLGRTI